MLTLRGYVDTMTCSTLLKKITDILNSGIFHIVVDMAQVNYVSSAGWGVFVGEIKGIREKYGDLKIVQMTPEVYDVFEMLEFNKILSYYDAIEEAINDFDLSIGLDITRSAKRSYSSANMVDVAVSPPAKVNRPPQATTRQHTAAFAFSKPQVDERLLPLNEKIRLVVIDNPNRGALKIKKALNTKRFGYVKINIIKVFRLLKKLNLENKQQRFRYYRSR